MKEIPCTQGSQEWYALRCGIPTASEFGRIITPAKGEYASGAETYAAELIAASLGEESDFKGTPDTERGAFMEREALDWLLCRHDMVVRPVGFCLADNGLYGASPDGMLEDGITPVEIKCPALRTFFKWAAKGGLPDDHKAQVHGEMYVTGAERCIFVAYAAHPLVENMVVEVRRDAFTGALGKCIDRFTARLEELQRMHLGENYDQYRADRAKARAAAIVSAAKPAKPAYEPLPKLMSRLHRETA